MSNAPVSCGTTFRRKPLKRYTDKPRRNRQRPIIAVDIETDDLGGDFIIGMWLAEDEEQPTIFTTIEQWVDALFSKKYRGYTWYAHNGGEYDFKYLINALRERAKERKTLINPVCSGDRVIGFVIKEQKRRIELRDSFALMPSSLAKLSKSFAPEYAKKDIGLGEGVTFDPHNDEHMEYLEYDVRGLLLTIQRFRETVLELFGVPCGWTAPSTALRAWMKTIPPEKLYWRLNRHAEAFIRHCYYGGLVFLSRNDTVEDCVSVDFNSMYPSVMRDFGVPTGLAFRCADFMPECIGFYQVIAHVPEDCPFTMVAYKEAGGVLWPTGDFETYITSIEMAFAEQHGCSFEFLDGYIFDEHEMIFQDFIDQCERQRIEFKGTGREDVIKIMQNGLYGKFGSRSQVMSYLLCDESDVDYEQWTPVHDVRTGVRIEGFYFKPEAVEDAHIMPHWASYITAQARLRLAGAVYGCGPEDVIYGDTDSITMRRSAYERGIASGALVEGVKYGMVKLEHEYVTFRAGGPKNYQGLLTDGNYVDKAKGIAKRVVNPEEHARALDGESVTVTYRSTNGSLAMLKNPKKPIGEQRKRTYSSLQNSKGWHSIGCGRVRPVHITALPGAGIEPATVARPSG